MAALLAYADAVDIGHGRGRLAAPAAASLRRVDAAVLSAFGRVLDINEAWRSPAQADANYIAYLWYLRGGPWAPIGLPATESIHCRGYAIDTDDSWLVAMLNDHGWFQTVYRNGNLVEPWHFEYDPSRDNHRHETAGNGAVTFDPNTPQEDDMFDEKAQAMLNALVTRAVQPLPTRVIRNTTSGDIVMLHPYGWKFVNGTDGSANGAALNAGQIDADQDGNYWVNLSNDHFTWELDRHKELLAELDKRIAEVLGVTPKP